MDDLLESIRSILATTPQRWTQLAATIAPDLLTRPPAPGEWSPIECLQHLVDAERWVFPVRMRALLAGEDFQAFDPEAQGTPHDHNQPPAALAAEFARLREANLAAYAALTPADLPRTARHSELGDVTLGELINEWAAHDLIHTMQAERALAQPFIRGCGPWQPIFAEHVIAAERAA